MARKWLYLVQIDAWYTERAVWGIAGAVVLVGAALGGFVHPLGVLLVAGVGLFSILAATTGYCLVSTALRNLGMPSRLAVAEPGPRWGMVRLYRMRTDRWYLERTIYLVVGVNLSLATVLVLVHSPWWLLFPTFVGTASLLFARTGFCPVANALWRLGLEPRLDRDVAVPEDERVAA